MLIPQHKLLLLPLRTSKGGCLLLDQYDIMFKNNTAVLANLVHAGI